jgi:hypothetical protein
MAIADGCRGHACLMPMHWEGGRWKPERPGWGLVSATTGEPISPPALITEEPIRMTNWELQDFAVQVVRQKLESQGRALMSWQGNPAANPSIWFVGDDGPEWLIVRPALNPASNPTPPSNWRAIARQCAKLSTTGHFVRVLVARSDRGAANNHSRPLRAMTKPARNCGRQ